MIRTWLVRLFSPLTTETAPAPPSLSKELEEYAQALGALGDGPRGLLPVLQARDRVEATRKEAQPLPTDQARHLIALDERLRERGSRLRMKELPAWRRTLRPPSAAWWWFLDQAVEEREKKRDLPWALLTGLLVLLTTTLTTEVLKRFWAGAPDIVSVFGTLLTLTLTASPLVKRGQELARWALDRVPRVTPRIRGEAMTGMAALAFLIVLTGRLLLPQLAVIYNNQGFAALQSGQLTTAQRKFRRAVALNPDLVVPYHNVAEVYQRINRPAEAQTWYQRAIERDLDFAPAYQGLGHLHNESEEHKQAERILLAGLQKIGDHLDEKTALVTRYRLLSELGWAYFAQARYELAQAALEEAVDLEAQLERWEEVEGAQYRQALPHYYLAQIYERSGQPAEAYEQWEGCLRLLRPGWESEAWRAMAVERLEELEAEIE